MKLVILELALTEYFLPFRRMRSAPGGRDFVWLTAMLALVLSLALLLLATQRGVLDRSVDIFLGKEQGYGIPVWVTPNYLREGGAPEFISSAMLAQLRRDGYKTAPYRNVSEDMNLIWLPGQDTWKRPGTAEAAGGHDARGFDGWAVDPSGPLWPAAARHDVSAEEGWSIVLNRELFAGGYFDFPAYKEGVQGRIPDAEYKRIEAAGEDPLALDFIWLELNLHRPRLVRFDVDWAYSLGLGNPIAFLMPLPLMHVITEARSHPNLCVFPERGVGGTIRVLTLREKFRLGMERPADFERRVERLIQLFEGEIVRRTPFYEIDLSRGYGRGNRCDPGWDKVAVENALDSLDLAFTPSNEMQSDPFAVEAHAVELPCNRLSRTTLDRYKGTLPASVDPDSEECRLAVPVATPNTGYLRVLVYVENRQALAHAIPHIDNYDDGRLRITDIYRDALDRFSFLSGLIDSLRTPFALYLFLFLSLVLVIQIGTLIDHRRIRYGLMLARGMSSLQLHRMLVYQMIVSVIVAFAFSMVALGLAHAYVKIEATKLSETYIQVTGGREIDALPIVLEHLLLSVACVLLFVILYSLAYLRLIGIGSRPAIDALMGD